MKDSEMKSLLRKWTLVMACALSAAATAHSEPYPVRPIHFLIGTAVGGIADILGRVFAEGLSKKLGTPVVPINRDGANGVIAARQVVAARPDGYTIGFQPAGAFVSQPFLNKDLGYTDADIDFLCQVFELPLALAVPIDSPIRNIQELVEAAGKRPGELNVGHSGRGSIPQIGLARLEKVAGIRLNQVPFRGDGETTNNLLGRHLDAGAVGLTTLGGKPMRVLAVFSEKRVPSHPAVPTMMELGFPIVMGGMVGLYTRKGIPTEAREKLVSACKEVTLSEGYIRASAGANQPVSYLSPERWAARISIDSQQNKAAIEALPPGP